MTQEIDGSIPMVHTFGMEEPGTMMSVLKNTHYGELVADTVSRDDRPTDPAPVKNRRRWRRCRIRDSSSSAGRGPRRTGRSGHRQCIEPRTGPMGGAFPLLPWEEGEGIMGYRRDGV
jgi:hypothetical protein